jgi:hypothetical protein
MGRRTHLQISGTIFHDLARCASFAIIRSSIEAITQNGRMKPLQKVKKWRYCKIGDKFDLLCGLQNCLGVMDHHSFRSEEAYWVASRKEGRGLELEGKGRERERADREGEGSSRGSYSGSGTVRGGERGRGKRE